MLEKSEVLGSWLTFCVILGTFLVLAVVGSTNLTLSTESSMTSATDAIMESVSKGMAATGIVCDAEANGGAQPNTVTNH